MTETTTFTKSPRAEEVLKPKPLAKLMVVMQEYKVKSLEKAEIEERLDELKDQIMKLMIENDQDSLATDYGTTSIRSASERMTFDKGKAVQMLAEHGIAADELEKCYKKSIVQGGVSIRLSKD